MLRGLPTVAPLGSENAAFKFGQSELKTMPFNHYLIWATEVGGRGARSAKGMLEPKMT